MQDIVLFAQQHWLLSLALAIVLILLMLLELNKAKRSAMEISPAQAVQLINRSQAVVIDVRSEALFTEGHIIGAISSPAAEVEKNLKKLEKFKSRPVVIACTSGLESSRTATLLTSHDFNVTILAGGMRAWQEANMPVVKGKG